MKYRWGGVVHLHVLVVIILVALRVNLHHRALAQGKLLSDLLRVLLLLIFQQL